MTLDEIEKWANLHEDGNEPRGDYPDCLRCRVTMETPAFLDEACAFCNSCMYAVADDLAHAQLAMLPVIRAADAAAIRWRKADAILSDEARAMMEAVERMREALR